MAISHLRDLLEREEFFYLHNEEKKAVREAATGAVGAALPL